MKIKISPGILFFNSLILVFLFTSFVINNTLEKNYNTTVHTQYCVIFLFCQYFYSLLFLGQFQKKMPGQGAAPAGVAGGRRLSTEN
jgi:hypothetical protein